MTKGYFSVPPVVILSGKPIHFSDGNKYLPFGMNYHLLVSKSLTCQPTKTYVSHSLAPYLWYSWVIAFIYLFWLKGVRIFSSAFFRIGVPPMLLCQKSRLDNNHNYFTGIHSRVLTQTHCFVTHNMKGSFKKTAYGCKRFSETAYIMTDNTLPLVWTPKMRQGQQLFRCDIMSTCMLP